MIKPAPSPMRLFRAENLSKGPLLSGRSNISVEWNSSLWPLSSRCRPTTDTTTRNAITMNARLWMVLMSSPVRPDRVGNTSGSAKPVPKPALPTMKESENASLLFPSSVMSAISVFQLAMKAP